MEDDINLRKEIFMSVIRFEWLKSPFPYCDFINKSKYLLSKKNIKFIENIKKDIERKFSIKLEELDLLCSNPESRGFIYVNEQYRDAHGILRDYNKKMSVNELNNFMYHELVSPIHEKLKKECLEELNL